MPKYVEFAKRGGNLVITLTREGREELRDGSWKDDPERAFFALIEWQLANGWELLRPEEVGALTEATIISDDVERDDDGELINLGRVYSNIGYYQIRSDVEELLHTGKLVWPGVDDDKDFDGLGSHRKSRSYCVTARSPREAAKKLRTMGGLEGDGVQKRRPYGKDLRVAVTRRERNYSWRVTDAYGAEIDRGGIKGDSDMAVMNMLSHDYGTDHVRMK